MSQDPSRLRRRILLIDKKFQLKFSFYVCTWIFVLSLIFPLIIYSLFEWIIEYSQTYLGEEASTLILDVKSDVFFNLVLLEFAFIGLTFLITLFLSHKIAGPIYKLKKTFHEAKEHPSISHVRFRKADHFQDLAESYNELMDHLRKNKDDRVEELSKIISKLESLPESESGAKEALEELKSFRQRLSF